jgi:hypothetical protein
MAPEFGERHFAGHEARSSRPDQSEGSENMKIQVKKLQPDDFDRPRLKDIKTGMVFADINLGDPRFGPPDWCTTTRDGEPIASIRKDVVFEVIGD